MTPEQSKCQARRAKRGRSSPPRVILLISSTTCSGFRRPSEWYQRESQGIAPRRLKVDAGLFHLNPARHYPRIFIEAAARLTDARIWMLAAGAFAYSALRFAEAYGLWRARSWAEFIGIVSGGIYLPVEALELIRRPTVLKAVLLAANALLVAYLSFVRYRDSRELRRRRRGGD
jgi:uncharacterized membrane protein (DUF2068 family)